MPRKSKKFWLNGNKKRKSKQPTTQTFCTQSNFPNSSLDDNRNKKDERCPVCRKYFTKLSVHLSRNPYCSDTKNNSDFSNDPSIVCHLTSTQIQNNSLVGTSQRSNNLPISYGIQNLNQHHLNLFKSNDNDQNLISINQYYNHDEMTQEDNNNEIVLDDSNSFTDVFDDHPLSQEQEEVIEHGDIEEDDVSLIFPSTKNNNTNIIPFNSSDFCQQIEKSNNLMLSSLGNNSSTNTRQHTDQTSNHHDLILYRDFTTIQHEIKWYQKNHIHLSIEFIHAIEVLKLMIDHQMPCSMFNELMKIQDSYTIRLINERLQIEKINSFPSLPKQKETVLKTVSKIMFDGILDPKTRSNYTLDPQTRNIQLPSLKRICSVTKFDLASLILSLLNDSTLTKPSNMLLEDKYFRNPELFDSLPDHEKYYGDIHTGSWFLNTYRKIIHKDHIESSDNEVLCPIIMFIDGTPIDTFGNLKLDAIMFTLGIYNRETRNKNESWRLVGYIPDTIDEELYNDGSPEANSKKRRQKQQRTDYHHNLHYLLQEFIDIQHSKGILWDYVDSQGNKTTVTLRPILSYIIGDALGNDKLCDRYQSYNKSTKFLCRDCLCDSDNLNNFNFRCTFTKRSFLKSLSEDELKERSYHKVDNNVFDILQFGYDEYGINGCTPCELLHQFLLGLVKKATDNFFECITAPGLSLLKKVSKYISTAWCRQSDRELPTIQMFNDDLVKKKLTGDEQMNLVFMLYITLSQTYVSNALVSLETGYAERTKTIQGNKVSFKKIGSSRGSIQKWVKLFERTMTFYYWIKQSKIEYQDLKQSDNNTFDSLSDIAIRKYMKYYNEVVVIPYGNGNKCMKDHQTLHIPHYIRRFGIPSNYDGGIGERHLKHITKQPARMTQKRQSLLSSQACKRYSENLMIRLVYQMLVANKSIDDIDQQRDIQSPISGCFTYILNETGDIVSIRTGSNDRKYMKSIHHEPSLIKKIFFKLKGEHYGLSCNEIHCFTKLSLGRDDLDNSIIFRSDPCFFSSVWFDWCITKWIDDDGNMMSYYPARILMFIDTTNMKFNQDVSNKYGRYLAIIKTTLDDDRPVRQRGIHSQCSFLKSYKIEDKIRIISCDAIEKTTYVIPDITNELIERDISEGIFQHQTISYVCTIESRETFKDAFIEMRGQQRQQCSRQQAQAISYVQPSVASNIVDENGNMEQRTDVSMTSL